MDSFFVFVYPMLLYLVFVVLEASPGKTPPSDL